MKTMTEQKHVLLMQYALESLIEDYEAAEKESDKYLIKLRLLDYIEKFDEDVDLLLYYMRLQESKFRPFIAVLKDMNIEHVKSKKCSRTQENPIGKIKVVIFGDE